MADQPKSRPVHRVMCRCKMCSRWWSAPTDPFDPAPSDGGCPCGGELEEVDWDAHRSTIPAAKPER